MTQTNKPSAASIDLLKRGSFIERIERYIAAEQLMVDGSLVISLSAPFGSGKSTFLEIWKEDLAFRKWEDEAVRPLVISVNAWKEDHIADPMLSVLLSMIAVLEKTNPKQAGRLKRSVEALLDFVKIGSSSIIESAICKLPFGRAFLSGVHAAAATYDRTRGEGILNAVKARQGLLKEINDSLQEAFGGNGAKTYVFVDELDRCRPDYAISYLEAIKHFFDVKGVVFVLCVDEGQLSSAAKAVFGPSLKFDEYFRKFSHRSVGLPAAGNLTESDLNAYVGSMLGRCLRRSTLSVPAKFNALPQIEEYLAELVIALGVTPRQLDEALRIIVHARTSPEGSIGTSGFIYDARFVLMALLRVTRKDVYDRFGKEDYCLNELHDILSQVRKLEKFRYDQLLQHRLKVFALGFNTKPAAFTPALKALLPMYFSEGDVDSKLSFFYADAPPSSPSYRALYTHIEDLMTLG